MGDREVGSKTDLVGELANLSKSSSSSSGGVGVRGGRRMVGCFEAMAALWEVNSNAVVSWSHSAGISPLAETKQNDLKPWM